MHDCIKKEIEDYEKEMNQPPGMITSILFKRLYEMDSMSYQQRASLEHLKDSAMRVHGKDQRANIGGCQDRCHLIQHFFKPPFLSDSSGYPPPIFLDSTKPDLLDSSYVSFLTID